MALRGVVHQLKVREAPALGIAGFGQQGPGPWRIVGNLRLGPVAVDIGRREAEGGQLAALGHFVHQLLAVYGQGQGLSHLALVQGRRQGVEDVVVGGKVGKYPEDFGPLFAIAGDLVHRHSAGDMQLPGAEHALFGGGVLHRIEHDAVQLDGGGVPVAGIFFHHDAPIQGPFLQFEGAVAHMIAGPRPPGAAFVWRPEFFNGGRVDGKIHRQRQELQEKRGGIFQFNPQGPLIQGRRAHLGEIRDRAAVKRLGVLDVVQHVGVVVAQGRQQSTPPGEDEILGRHRVAIRPLRPLPQLEQVSLAVVALLPGLGDGWDQLQGFRMPV